MFLLVSILRTIAFAAVLLWVSTFGFGYVPEVWFEASEKLVNSEVVRQTVHNINEDGTYKMPQVDAAPDLGGVPDVQMQESGTATLSAVYEETGYREFVVTGDTEIDPKVFEKAFNKIPKRAQGAVTDVAHAYYEYDKPENFNLRQPYLGGFVLGQDHYWLVESGREYREMSGKEQTFWDPVDPHAPGKQVYLYKNGEKIEDLTRYLGGEVCFGYDGREGMVNDIALVKDHAAFTFMSENCLDEEGIDNVYFWESDINENFSIKGSRFPFEFLGMMNFIGQWDGKEFLVHEGRVVSRGFSYIYTNSCCASPDPVFKISEDGYVYFTGKRDGQWILVETHVGEFNAVERPNTAFDIGPLGEEVWME